MVRINNQEALNMWRCSLLIFLIALALIIHVDLVDAAERQDTTWQNAYTYSLDEAKNTITLTDYIAGDSDTKVDITVPNHAIIHGKQYQTRIEGAVFAERIDLNSVAFQSGIKAVGDCSSLFEGCLYLKSIVFNDFDTSEVNNMSNMFAYCIRLEDADVSRFDTGHVTDMSGMFHMNIIKHIDVSGFDTRNVTNMWGMFSDSVLLEEIDVSNFDTSNVTNMAYMFCNCNSLNALDVTSLDTSKVTHMAGMFSELSVEKLDLRNLDTSACEYMHSMFQYCMNIKSLDLSNFNTGKVEDMSKMFWGCQNLEELNIDNFDTRNVTDMEGMFAWCTHLKHIDMNHISWSSAEQIGSLEEEYHDFLDGFFEGCSDLQWIDLSDVETSDDLDFSDVFRNCSSLESICIGKGVHSIKWDCYDNEEYREYYFPFNECDNLKTIYYAGTEEEWNRIKGTKELELLLDGVEIVFNNETCDPNVITSEDIKVYLADIPVKGTDIKINVESLSGCTAAVIKEDGTYEILKAQKNSGEDTFSFTVPSVQEDMTIAIVKRGDLNLDGKIAVNDVTMAKAASLSKLDLAPEAKLAVDMNGDGVIRPNEVAMLRAAALKKTELSWEVWS